MSALDLQFKDGLGNIIYDPETITGAFSTIQVTNLGDTDLVDLGLYITPATSVGDVDYPADKPPETDYQDLLDWGQAREDGAAAAGGILVKVPVNDSDFTQVWQVDDPAGVPAYTDLTTELGEATADDVQPFASPNTAGDHFYLGASERWTEAVLDVTTQGVDGTASWEYYNGTIWTALVVTDGTSDFTAAGEGTITFEPPTDWEAVAVNGVTKFYIRAVSDGAYSTLPILGQGWVVEKAEFVHRTQGATYATRIPMKDLPVGDSYTFEMLIETPPVVPSRRLYINIVVE